MTSGWGASSWGESPWGEGGGALALLSALAVSENRVRIEFSAAPQFDRLLTPTDASGPDRYSVAAVSGSSLDGEPVRPVLPTFVEVAAVEGGAGRFLDLWVDRAFTGYPAVYQVSANNIAAADDGSFLVPGASATFYGLRAGSPPPTAEHVAATRDLLLATSSLDYAASNVPLVAAPSLGALVPNAAGDYASASPLAAYKARVFRRATSVVGAFAHLSRTYGAGLPSHAKRSGRPGLAEVMAAGIERQVRLEPETTGVVVSASQTTSGVVRFRIQASARFGSVDVAVSTAPRG